MNERGGLDEFFREQRSEVPEEMRPQIDAWAVEAARLRAVAAQLADALRYTVDQYPMSWSERAWDAIAAFDALAHPAPRLEDEHATPDEAHAQEETP